MLTVRKETDSVKASRATASVESVFDSLTDSLLASGVDLLGEPSTLSMRIDAWIRKRTFRAKRAILMRGFARRTFHAQPA